MRPSWEIDDGLYELREAGLVWSGGEALAAQQGPPPLQPRADIEWEWQLTPAGHERATAWIASVLPLFGGWPPDVAGVDDAGGPEAAPG